LEGVGHGAGISIDKKKLFRKAEYSRHKSPVIDEAGANTFPNTIRDRRPNLRAGGILDSK
jgi:hypothetical protein